MGVANTPVFEGVTWLLRRFEQSGGGGRLPVDQQKSDPSPVSSASSSSTIDFWSNSTCGKKTRSSLSSSSLLSASSLSLDSGVPRSVSSTQRRTLRISGEKGSRFWVFRALRGRGVFFIL